MELAHQESSRSSWSQKCEDLYLCEDTFIARGIVHCDKSSLVFVLFCLTVLGIDAGPCAC
jgi:hypothetical protein